MTEPSRYFITTPIYYVNARPHIGHAYSTIAADTMARYKRAQGAETHFLTGTDEHGQKIQRSAELAGKQPTQFVDEVAGEFRRLWDRLGIRYDDFIRTTEQRHQQGVQKFFVELQRRGFIYKGSYTGQYCVFDELYVDAPPGSPCPDCGRITETVSEENYFFKLSAFEQKLLDFYRDHPDFIRPETRRNEVLSFIRSGLKDLSISRTSFTWGVPVPGDPKHVIYVWLDALVNYISALGYGSDAPEDQARFARFWPADLHLIGKEISRFHCVYWPAFLMAAEMPLPKAIVAHGWLLFDQSKMSKSRGNIARAETVLDVMGDGLGSDALRYFLLREIVFGQDGNFSFEALVDRYNADLANGYGNLLSRTVAMISKYFDGAVPAGQSNHAIVDAAAKAASEFREHFEAFDFSRALEALWSLIATVDRYITGKAPWKLGKQQDEASRAELAEILYTCAEALRVITLLARPILPDATAKAWAQLGLGDISTSELTSDRWGQLSPATRLHPGPPIFPRMEKETAEHMQEIEKGGAPAVPTPAKPAEPPAAAPAQAIAAQPPAVHEKIGIEDFAKVELRVGEIRMAEKVKGADRLLRLEVDIATEVRQIVAGIAEAYAPESLIGRKVVIVANLRPRKLRGLESNGMIVAASLGDHGKPVLAGFLEDIENGARLK